MLYESLCKIFTALALSKYLSQLDTDFSKTKSQVIAAAIALSPAVLSVLQHEAGLALAGTGCHLRRLQGVGRSW